MVDKATLTWQRRMAPFMTASIVVAAVCFIAITVFEYSRLEQRLTRSPPPMEDVWATPSSASLTNAEQFERSRARAAFALERELIARRYDQANLTLSASLWTRLMGFVTGMILALVGAAFVLGKLSEEVTEGSMKGGVPGQEWSLTLRSASPGIILAVMGSLLMTVAIFVQASIASRDQAIYFGRVVESGSDAPAKSAEDCELCKLVPGNANK